MKKCLKRIQRSYIGKKAARRAALGLDTAIDITVIDEINTRVKIQKLLSRVSAP